MGESLPPFPPRKRSADESREEPWLAQVAFPEISAFRRVDTAVDVCADEARSTWAKTMRTETVEELEWVTAYSARRYTDVVTCAAAAQVDAATQQLLTITDSPISPPLRREIVQAQQLALAAAEAVVGRPVDARRFLEEAHGPRLTACYGRGYQRIPPTRLAVLRALDREAEWPDPAYVGFMYGDGCGSIYRDSQRRPKLYCDACHRRRTHRQTENLERVQRMAAGRFPFPPYAWAPDYWFGSCSSCGANFANTNPGATRCKSCHR